LRNHPGTAVAAQDQAQGLQLRAAFCARRAAHHLRRRRQARAGSAQARGGRVPQGRQGCGVHPGAAELLQRRRELADADVHAGVHALVRLLPAGAGIPAHPDSVGRYLQPLPSGCVAPGARLGPVQRHRRRRPGRAADPERLPRQRGQLHHVRRSQRQHSQLDSAAFALAQGLYADLAGAHARPGAPVSQHRVQGLLGLSVLHWRRFLHRVGRAGAVGAVCGLGSHRDNRVRALLPAVAGDRVVGQSAVGQCVLHLHHAGGCVQTRLLQAGALRVDRALLLGVAVDRRVQGSLAADPQSVLLGEDHSWHQQAFGKRAPRRTRRV
ncbi:hypothetical protein XPR_4230, partial [Xanthomonas arboricola pv. pruni MAFF 301420]